MGRQGASESRRLDYLNVPESSVEVQRFSRPEPPVEAEEKASRVLAEAERGGVGHVALQRRLIKVDTSFSCASVAERKAKSTELPQGRGTLPPVLAPIRASGMLRTLWSLSLQVG